MYKFNYKHIMLGGATATCIVPSAWLPLPLPAFGEQINYIDSEGALCSLPDFIFAFSEEPGTQLFQSVLLTIYRYPPNEDSAYIRVADHSTKIIFVPSGPSDLGQAQCAVCLLNHIFGSLALSASLGNIYLDFGEVVRWITESRELRYSFGIGSTPEEIFPQLQGQFPDDGSDRTFAMLFCREEAMQLGYLTKLSNRFTRGGLSIVADAAVAADRMLISVLASGVA